MPTNRSLTLAARLALPLTGMALFFATPVTALPIGPGGGGDTEPGDPGDPPLPVNHAPKAKFTAPNNALVTTLLQLSATQSAHTSARTLEIGDLLYGSGDKVTFTSTSTDQDGLDDIVKYTWDFGDGTAVSTGGPSDHKTVTHRYFNTGTFTPKLKVEDAGGLWSTTVGTSHDIVVHAAPHPVLAVDIAKPLVGQDVKFSGAGTTADPTIKNVAWDLDGNGTYETDSGTSLDAHASYQTPGTRSVGMRITDSWDVVRTASVKVQVNQLPTAAFTSTAAVAGQKVTFDGAGSGDDAPIADYAWDLDGDGTYETDTHATPTATKTYAAAGTVNVRLRVTDTLGATSIVTHAVVVAPAPAAGPGGGSGVAGTTAGSAGAGGAGASGNTQSSKLAPVLKFGSLKAKLGKNGKLTIKLTCPKTATSCKGKLKLQTTGKRPASLGSAPFTLKAGKATSLKITVPANKRGAIRRDGHLKANAVVTVVDSAGVTGATTTGILIGL